MAEASVPLLVTGAAVALGAGALRHPTSLVSEEISLLLQVPTKIMGIKVMSVEMMDFLRHMDVEGVQGVATAWAEQVREVARELEVIIDEYSYLLGSGHRRRSRVFLRKALGRTHKAASDIAQRLEDIDSMLRRLFSIKERYGIKTVEGRATSSQDVEKWSQVVVSSHLYDDHDDELVGMKGRIDDLLGWLTDQEPQRKLISVWGMGGLGKTTLAAKVFRSHTVKEHFHRQAWVTVSATDTVDGLLRKILTEFFDREEIMPHVEKMGHSNLVETLHEHLQDKRYLLVLDDVRNTSVWKDVSDALTLGDCGSRIILTTQKYDVASEGDNVMELQPLDENDAWVLFRRKAFRNEPDTVCPSHLQQPAKAILTTCGGLPLAIIALGSLVSLRGTEEVEWKRVYDDIHWLLINNPQSSHLTNILLLSFIELPDYLKHCFLYCSIFKEDYSISRKRLIRLWGWLRGLSKVGIR